MTVVANTAQSTTSSAAGLAHPLGSKVAVQRSADGTAFIEIRDVAPADVVVLVNHP